MSKIFSSSLASLQKGKLGKGKQKWRSSCKYRSTQSAETQRGIEEHGGLAGVGLRPGVTLFSFFFLTMILDTFVMG